MLSLLSPAKINLFLIVGGKLPDGYHRISTLMQAISLHDRIDFTLSKIDSLMCNDESLINHDSNLIMQAVRLFREKTGIKFAVKVNLDKVIPMQAGLGGGSSNAATTLWALNELLGRPATLSDLQCWSAEIGTDVPFFFSSGTAHCTGRGEFIRSLPAPEERTVWILKPSFGISTRVVYQRFQSDEAQPVNPDQLLEGFLKGHLNCINNLEEPAFAIDSRLALLKKSLTSQGLPLVSMSGSGSAFYSIGDTPPPSFPHTQNYQASFIQRTQGRWY